MKKFSSFLYDLGLYWIDPNEGSAVDAIFVHCRMDTMETCIQPSPRQFDRQRWNKEENTEKYFMEEMNDGKQVKIRMLVMYAHAYCHDYYAKLASTKCKYVGC